jgi:RsiW-degrading membrane proteinase PrsW (M82 family)
VWRTDREREPVWLVVATFTLGGVLAGAAHFLLHRAAAYTGLDVRTSVAGNTGALLFVFGVIEPVKESAKVAAAWPAFLSRHFDEPYDGIVYASASALGFAAVDAAVVLRAHPEGGIWIARTLLALPAHAFFACLWGYALGRSKQSKRPGPLFPAAFVGALAGHGLYAHFIYGRGPGALWATLPMLLMMGGLTWFFGRDLRARGDRPSRIPYSTRLSRLSYLSAPPSLSAVRSALKRADEPIKVRWILFGALVTIGGMILGLVAAVAAAAAMKVDFSTVDERDVSATWPVLFLGVGLLFGFLVSGWLIARAAGVRTLLEPALATVLAITVTLIAFGIAAPSTVTFGLALAPIAWALSCVGAWMGRVAD